MNLHNLGQYSKLITWKIQDFGSIKKLKSQPI
jgi:hypothetical protein